MLYLTLLKIVADFLGILLQVHIQLIFPEKKFCFCSHLAETDTILN